MVSTLLFVVAAQPQQQPDLYRTIIKKPTGENGYEEYLQAADIALAAKVSELVEFVEDTNQRGTKLDRQRMLVRQLGRLPSLVEQGNKKPVFYPNEMDFDTLLPELSAFRWVGRAMVIKADVHFADGQVNQGFSTLASVIEFGDKLSGSGPLIHNLVGRAINQPALQSLAKHANLMSVPAANDLQSRTKVLLNSPSPWINAMRIEMKAIVDSMPMFMDRIDDFVGTEGMTSDLAAIKSLSDEQKKQVVNELRFTVTRHYQARLDMLQRPEKEWPKLAAQIDSIQGPDNPIAAAVFEAIVPAFARIDLYEIARRTHFRLIAAYSEVVKFRWDHGYYPGSLDQLEDTSVAYDPLTDGPFEYRRTETGFELYSKGTEETGRIDFFYSPPRSSNAKPD